MTTRVKIIHRPTPVRNAVLWVSLTSNVFLFGLGYAVVSGSLARVEGAEQAQQVDYLTAMTKER